MTNEHAVEATVAGWRAVNQLLQTGWTRTPSLGRQFTITKESDQVAVPAALTQAVDGLEDVVDALVLDGRFGSMSLRVECRRGEPPLVVDLSQGDVEHEFSGAALQAAERAWHDDAEAALRLEGVWSARATVNLAHALDSADPSVEWRVFGETRELESHIASGWSWWVLGAAGAPDRPTMWVACSGDAMALQTGTGSFYTLEVSPSVAVPATPTTSVEAASPHVFVPLFVANTDASRRLSLQLWRLAAAVAWSHVASDIVATDEPDSKRLEFFGYKRTSHLLHGAGPEMAEGPCRDALELWRWATSTDSPDRLLAVRQVVSLYHETAPWAKARDIRFSALPLFLALRSDAVAEAFAQQREARSFAFDVARQSAAATTALARSAAERCLAALLAIGGVVVAEASATLSSRQADDLGTLLAVFLVALAAWNALVEGSSVSIALRNLTSDLDDTALLLSADERKQIAETATVTASRRFALTVRISVPIVYCVAAVAAVVLA